jgi:uncharacterized ion transporter superfamily protein YfcC
MLQKESSQTVSGKPMKWMSKIQMPHIYLLICMMILLIALCTYIIPAGSFDRVTGPSGREMIDPTSYKTIVNTPTSLFGLLESIPKGLREASDIIFSIFVIGGMFTVLNRAGVIAWGVHSLVTTFAKRNIIVIPVLMFTFSITACFIDTPELSLVYVPIILPVMLKLGFDRITAAAIALCGTIAGYTGALTNPFTVGIAQKISGIPLYSGISFRLIVLLVTTAVGIAYVMRYAMKVKKNAEKYSLTFSEDELKRKELEIQEQNTFQATTRQKIASIVTLLLFAGMIYGVLTYQWSFITMSGYFIAMGVTAAVIVGLRANQIAESFNDGFKDVLMGAMLCGVVRALTVVMTEGHITDTIIYGLSQVISQIPGSIAVVGMLFVQSFINFFIPSGSGMALVTMPIMAPLADLIGVTRQTAVLAYQFGDGFSNIVFPTSGYFMATLAVAGISYKKWIKFIIPLYAVWMVMGTCFLLIAHAIGWS